MRNFFLVGKCLIRWVCCNIPACSCDFHCGMWRGLSCMPSLKTQSDRKVDFRWHAAPMALFWRKWWEEPWSSMLQMEIWFSTGRYHGLLTALCITPLSWLYSNSNDEPARWQHGSVKWTSCRYSPSCLPIMENEAASCKTRLRSLRHFLTRVPSFGAGMSDSSVISRWDFVKSLSTGSLPNVAVPFSSVRLRLMGIALMLTTMTSAGLGVGLSGTISKSLSICFL